jgi:aminopeptidase-like protein
MEFINNSWTFVRSITGKGNRETLHEIKKVIPELEIIEVPSGTKIWDWTVPEEWEFNFAYIENEKGVRVIDSEINNLHVVSYSSPINKIMDLKDLETHLYSIPDKPLVIPYRTTYYENNWGFCIQHSLRKSLKPGNYKVVIDSKFIKGSMSIGEIFIPGKVKTEIMFTTYICHPMMANNELSGPAVALALASYLRDQENYYSYRILFVPETIGSIYFINKNFKKLKRNLLAGYVLTCLGDDLSWSYLSSRVGNTISDKVAKRVLQKLDIKYKEFSFLERGSDERQYCSPKIDLPVCSVMRSKYGTYEQYHTSADNLEFISEKGLGGSINFYKEVISEFEENRVPVLEIYCEPFFSKRKMRNTLGGENLSNIEKLISDISAFSDGSNDFYEMSKMFHVKIDLIISTVEFLTKNKILSIR